MEQLPTDAEVLTRIEAFCERTGMSLTAFGRAAIGDGSLVNNLRGKRSLTLRTAQKVADFMATYRPTANAA